MCCGGRNWTYAANHQRGIFHLQGTANLCVDSKSCNRLTLNNRGTAWLQVRTRGSMFTHTFAHCFGGGQNLHLRNDANARLLSDAEKRSRLQEENFRRMACERADAESTMRFSFASWTNEKARRGCDGDASPSSMNPRRGELCWSSRFVQRSRGDFFSSKLHPRVILGLLGQELSWGFSSVIGKDEGNKLAETGVWVKASSWFGRYSRAQTAGSPRPKQSCE